LLNQVDRVFEKETFNLADVCDLLSISSATAKNWVKLNKLTPTSYENGKPLFLKSDMLGLVEEIQSGVSKKLKSRRNKKHVTGSFFYKDYVSETSVNLKTVQSLLDYIVSNDISLSENEIKYVLADCAKKLFLSKNQNGDNFSCLIDDLATGENDLKNKHSEIFQLDYIYEECEDILGLLYLSLSTISSRKARGAYFTPTKIVKKVIENIDFKSDNSFDNKIVDPCCGSGNFLLQLPKTVKIEQIYGKDIDLTSIKLTRINMALKFNPENVNVLYENFSCGNFLFEKEQNKYRHIIGNPPWGYNFKQNELAKLKTLYSSADNKNVESYDVFIEKSLNCLSKTGELFFVVPEAILNVKTHKTIRKIISQSSKIVYLEYLGNMFDKVQCPSIIFKLQKSGKPMTCVGLRVKTRAREFVINSERDVSCGVFNFEMDDVEYKIYAKILSIPEKVYLKDNGIFALGIVTGDNAEYIKKEKTLDTEPILKGSNISKYKIQNVDNYIKFLPDKFQQVAPVEYYRAPEKLFYKFISDKLVFAYDNNKTLSLNSCNILIPTFKNLDIKYVMAILNSSVAQFIFQKQFNSIKVLRSHIESIPIPIASESLQKEIINIVNELLVCQNSLKFDDLYENLDNMISTLYDLSNEEYSVIKSVIV
jgi:predicted RNA methylase